MKQTRRERLEDLVAEVRSFRFCGPSDDSDYITWVTSNYRYLVVQLRRQAGPLLPEEQAKILYGIECEIDDLYAAYDAKAEVDALLPDIEAAAEYADDPALAGHPNAYVIDPDLVKRVTSAEAGGLDLSFLGRICAEINSSYAHGNIIATALLMRAVLNHVPPIFGKDSFRQVAATVPRSLKDSFCHLEDGLRKIADFHTHRPMRKADAYPSRVQVDPFKPQFELLLQEILKQIEEGRSNKAMQTDVASRRR